MTKQTVSVYPALLSAGITSGVTGGTSYSGTGYSYVVLANTVKNATGTFTNTSSSDVTTLVTGLSSIYKKPNLALTCMKNGTRVYQYI